MATNPALGTPIPPPVPSSVSEATKIKTVLAKSFATSDAFHHNARAFRNRIVVGTVLAVTAAACLVALQWHFPHAEFLPKPTGTTKLSASAELLIVMIVGAVGGLVITVPAMAVIGTVDSPYNFPLYQAFLKIAVGSLTAVIGIVVTGTSGATNGYSSFEALIGAAFVFGAAQQAVTQLLDKRAGEIIDAVH